MLDVNQDPLGKQAQRLIKDKNIQIWVKELEDGSKAVGIFNLGNVDEVYDLLFSSLGYPVVNEVRDVWRQTDIPNITSSMQAEFALSRRKLFENTLIGVNLYQDYYYYHNILSMNGRKNIIYIFISTLLVFVMHIKLYSQEINEHILYKIVSPSGLVLDNKESRSNSTTIYLCKEEKNNNGQLGGLYIIKIII